MTAGREVVEDYRSTGLSLRRHPVSFLRADLHAQRIVRCADLANARDGQRLTVAGIVLVRQRPGSARGVLFITIEDETGHANLIVWPSVFDRQRRLVLTASMLACRGKVQREGEVIHVIADHLTDLSALLRSVGGAGRRVPAGARARRRGHASQRRRSARAGAARAGAARAGAARAGATRARNQGRDARFPLALHGCRRGGAALASAPPHPPMAHRMARDDA